MRRLVLPAIVAASLVAAPFAFAAESATGTVKSFDMKAHTLTLDSGITYQLPAGFKDPGLKKGEAVKVSWDMKGGKHQAESVTIQK